MEFITTATSYCVELSVEVFQKIVDKDDEVEKPLVFVLDELDGVCEVDYNGHFGPNIFFTVDADHDGEEKKKEIQKAIEDYMD